MTIHEMYIKALNTPSDIQEHLNTLRLYGLDCESVVELGVRFGVSTIALLSSCPTKMTSYDIHLTDKAKDIWTQARNEGIDFDLIEGNSAKIEIPECDLLFIDTDHTSVHLEAELTLNTNKVRKYIILHDTVTCGICGGNDSGMIPDEKGLMYALIPFLSIGQWKVKEHFNNNNGLTILGRV